MSSKEDVESVESDGEEAVSGSESPPEAKKKAKSDKKDKSTSDGEKKSKNKKSKEKSNDSEEKKPRKPYERTKLTEMVIEALDTLQDNKGVSLAAIKVYLEDNFKVDTVQLKKHIKKVILDGVEKGTIIRTKGVGVAGCFKSKHTKPTMIKKRLPPKEYMELPAKQTYKKRKVVSKAASPVGKKKPVVTEANSEEEESESEKPATNSRKRASVSTKSTSQKTYGKKKKK